MSKKLFQVTNKAGRKSLVIASDVIGAEEVALHNGVVRDVNNLKIKDFSATYMNADRLAKGLNYDSLEDGIFVQEMNGNRSKWITYNK